MDVLRSLLARQLILDEGTRAHPYQDTKGVWTCGRGWNMEAVPMCIEAMNAQFSYQMEIAINDCRVLFDNFNNLPEEVQAALANMAYQLGRTSLSGFVNMRDAIKRGDLTKAADEAMDSEWGREFIPRATRIANILRKYGKKDRENS